jgi:hypothetical protein
MIERDILRAAAKYFAAGDDPVSRFQFVLRITRAPSAEVVVQAC